MKLSKETLANIPVLRVENQITLSDCEILAAGLRKLSQSSPSLALDLSQTEPLPPPVQIRLESICLELCAKSPGDFWIIGPTPWAHVSTFPQLEELLARPPLAASQMDSWYQQRTQELQDRQSSLHTRLPKSGDSKIFSLRRENSRLERRLKILELEWEIKSSFRSDSTKEAKRIRERIAAAIEHAISSSGRRL
ncbi:hypothetical protein EBZ37_00770 [bacterium]|nr:hypothetical protein [bacterium]